MTMTKDDTLVVGSIPTAGAIFPNEINILFFNDKSNDKLLKLAIGIFKTLHIDICFRKPITSGPIDTSS